MSKKVKKNQFEIQECADDHAEMEEFPFFDEEDAPVHDDLCIPMCRIAKKTFQRLSDERDQAYADLEMAHRRDCLLDADEREIPLSAVRRIATAMRYNRRFFEVFVVAVKSELALAEFARDMRGERD